MVCIQLLGAVQSGVALRDDTDTRLTPTWMSRALSLSGGRRLLHTVIAPCRALPLILTRPSAEKRIHGPAATFELASTESPAPSIHSSRKKSSLLTTAAVRSGSTKTISRDQPSEIPQVLPSGLGQTVTAWPRLIASIRATCRIADTSFAAAASRLRCVMWVKLGAARVTRTASTTSVIASSTSVKPLSLHADPARILSTTMRPPRHPTFRLSTLDRHLGQE